jgi:hypothetical protein
VLLSSMWVEEVLVEGSRPVPPQLRSVPDEVEDSNAAREVVVVLHPWVPVIVVAPDVSGLDGEEGGSDCIAARDSSDVDRRGRRQSLRGSQQTHERCTGVDSWVHRYRVTPIVLQAVSHGLPLPSTVDVVEHQVVLRRAGAYLETDREGVRGVGNGIRRHLIAQMGCGTAQRVVRVDELL